MCLFTGLDSNAGRPGTCSRAQRLPARLEAARPQGAHSAAADCRLACLLACLPACLPVCLLACLPACLPATQQSTDVNRVCSVACMPLLTCPARVQARFLQVVTQALRNTQGQTAILLTGHSMGGALATLAANDLRRELAPELRSRVRVSCYTYGAPRLGAPARRGSSLAPLASHALQGTRAQPGALTCRQSRLCQGAAARSELRVLGHHQ